MTLILHSLVANCVNGPIAIRSLSKLNFVALHRSLDFLTTPVTERIWLEILSSSQFRVILDKNTALAIFNVLERSCHRVHGRMGLDPLRLILLLYALSLNTDASSTYPSDSKDFSRRYANACKLWYSKSSEWLDLISACLHPWTRQQHLPFLVDSDLDILNHFFLSTTHFSAKDELMAYFAKCRDMDLCRQVSLPALADALADLCTSGHEIFIQPRINHLGMVRLPKKKLEWMNAIPGRVDAFNGEFYVFISPGDESFDAEFLCVYLSSRVTVHLKQLSGRSFILTLPKDISVYVEECHDCQIYLLGHPKSVHVSSCSNIVLSVAVITRELVLTDCQCIQVNATCDVALIRGVREAQLGFYTPKRPILVGGCHGIAFTPCAMRYAGLSSHMKRTEHPFFRNQSRANLWEDPLMLRGQGLLLSRGWRIPPVSSFFLRNLPISMATAHDEAEDMILETFPLPRVYELWTRACLYAALTLSKGGGSDAANARAQLSAHFADWLQAKGKIPRIIQLLRHFEHQVTPKH